MAEKKAGFLTKPQREYLRLPPKQRRKTHSANDRNQIDDAIREQANSALDDLLLIAQGYDEEGLQTIFSKDNIEMMVGTLMQRIGLDDAEGNQHYYEIFLNAIEQCIHQKYRQQNRFFKLESTHYPVMPHKPAYRDIKEYLKK
jgi:hypothetical protein